MSLGAIDFGIIIDGSVIIVEYIAFKLSKNLEEINRLNKAQSRAKIDRITLKSASKMMKSAIFGQLIILIVFIPVLTLSGVEGKMFKPMALTFSYAIIGAMIFGLTYIPVMSSLLIKPVKEKSNNISIRIMKSINKLYDPAIKWALAQKKIVLGASLGLLFLSIYIFTTIGSEFVPTLDEGDLVIQPVLKTGTSLNKTIEITTRIENILLEKIPEVEQVVSRIGAAEIPTDPMSMEESDVIVKLKPKNQWVKARSKNEIINRIRHELSVIPGMQLEFTQPIEMRFNELITGVRSDIAVKIFGDDLNILSSKGEEIRSIIENIKGAEDVNLEKNHRSSTNEN